METAYEIITAHQKLICALNILTSIENPNTNVIKARMSVEDEIQDSWVRCENLTMRNLILRKRSRPRA